MGKKKHLFFSDSIICPADGIIFSEDVFFYLCLSGCVCVCHMSARRDQRRALIRGLGTDLSSSERALNF